MTAQPRNGHDNSALDPMVAAGEVGRRMYEPAINALARSNAELLSLASRRAQAYMELPARIGTCRSPQDLVAEQTRFAQTAWTQYADCCTHMMAACQALSPQTAGMMEFWQSAMRMPASGALTTSRLDDLGGGEDGSELEERRPGQRRAA